MIYDSLPFGFKILDQCRELTEFEFYVTVTKNKHNERIVNSIIIDDLLEPWEMNFSFNIIPKNSEEMIDITSLVYRELKKSDIYNTCELTYSYDYDLQYSKETISFQHEPIKFKKFFQTAGFKTRLGLNPDNNYQEHIDEFMIRFKDIKFLDTLIEQMKQQIKDSSYVNIDLKDLKNQIIGDNISFNLETSPVNSINENKQNLFV